MRRKPWRPLRERRVAWSFLLPAIVGMLLVHFLPLLQLTAISLLDSHRGNLEQGLAAPMASGAGGAFANYASVLADAADPFHLSLVDAVGNTLVYTTLVVFLSTSLGLGGALLLEKAGRAKWFWRGLLMVPWIVPSYVVGLVWGILWQQDSGAINHLLHALGWLGDDRATWPMWLSGSLTRWALIVPAVWREWPLALLIFSLGLERIPRQIHEASVLDGRGAWSRFREIIAPLLRPSFGLALLHGVVYNAYSFNLPFMLFGAGSGYGGKSGDLLVPALYRNTFQRWEVGRGAAASVVLVFAMLVLVAVWYRVFRSDLEEIA